MATNDRVARVSGNIVITGENAPTQNLVLDAFTQTFNHIAEGTVTLALSANHTITFADYGMSDPIDFFYAKVRDSVDGSPVVCSFATTVTGTGQGGIGAADGTVMASDIMWFAYDFQDCNTVLVSKGSGGNPVEVYFIAGGN